MGAADITEAADTMAVEDITEAAGITEVEVTMAVEDTTAAEATMVEAITADTTASINPAECFSIKLNSSILFQPGQEPEQIAETVQVGWKMGIGRCIFAIKCEHRAFCIAANGSGMVQIGRSRAPFAAG